MLELVSSVIKINQRRTTKQMREKVITTKSLLFHSNRHQELSNDVNSIPSATL